MIVAMVVNCTSLLSPARAAPTETPIAANAASARGNGAAMAPLKLLVRALTKVMTRLPTSSSTAPCKARGASGPENTTSAKDDMGTTRRMPSSGPTVSAAGSLDDPASAFSSERSERSIPRFLGTETPVRPRFQSIAVRQGIDGGVGGVSVSVEGARAVAS